MVAKKLLKILVTFVIPAVALVLSVGALYLDDAHFNTSKILTEEAMTIEQRHHEDSMKLAQAAIAIEKKHYEELTRPHAKHEEIYNYLIRLDDRIENASKSVRRWESFGAETENLQGLLRKIETRRDEVDKAWLTKDYEKAKTILVEAYNLLDQIQQPPLPPAPAPAPAPVPEPPAGANWWLLGSIIAASIITAMFLWLVMRRRR